MITLLVMKNGMKYKQNITKGFFLICRRILFFMSQCALSRDKERERERERKKEGGIRNDTICTPPPPPPMTGTAALQGLVLRPPSQLLSLMRVL